MSASAASAPLPQAVADGVFYAELNELLMRELGGEGYSGVEVRGSDPLLCGMRWASSTTCSRVGPSCTCLCPTVHRSILFVHSCFSQVRVTPMRTEVIIRATRTQNVLGEHADC